MTPPPSRSAWHIATAAAREQPAGPEHRRFKALLTKIEAARERLAGWHAQAPLFARAHAERVQPEHERLHAARRAWALELERIALGEWAKPDRETLARMVCELCGTLLEAGEPGEAPDEEIKAVYNRFAAVDYDTEARLQVQAMKAKLEAMGDVDLGSEPVHSVDELMERVQAEMARRHEAAGMAAADGAGAGPGPDAHAHRGAHRAKTKTAAQRRAEEDARRISQTVREVYRKLAAALHPDRIGAEATADERSERTARMQRANSAYEAGDLLALLTLQLEIEQVDVAHAASVAASQVKHFNKVLAEQLREIEAEIDERQMALCSSYGLVVHQRLKPEQLGALLKNELREIAAAAAELAGEQRALRGAPAVARRWLKQRRAEMRFEQQMDELLNEHLGQMTQVARAAEEAAQEAAQEAAKPPPRRRRR